MSILIKKTLSTYKRTLLLIFIQSRLLRITKDSVVSENNIYKAPCISRYRKQRVSIIRLLFSA